MRRVFAAATVLCCVMIGHGARAQPDAPDVRETVRGRVVRIDLVAAPGATSQGVHLTLKTAAETLVVHLGPAWYLERQPLHIRPKDELEIEGTRVVLGGRRVLIAALVRKGAQILRLRDRSGAPVWRGGGRRRPRPGESG